MVMGRKYGDGGRDSLSEVVAQWVAMGGGDGRAGKGSGKLYPNRGSCA